MRHHLHGFNLLELAVTLSVAGIALAIALPSFAALNARRQLTSAITDIHQLTQRARYEAMRLQQPLTVSIVGADTTSWQLQAKDSTGNLYASVSGSDYRNITLSGSGSATFSPMRGILTGNGFTLALSSPRCSTISASITRLGTLSGGTVDMSTCTG